MNETKTVDVIGLDGSASGSTELPGHLFDVQTNVPLIHQVVVAQLAAARAGTHATKTRGEVSGGGRKPWRQKGTGRARHGSRRSPQWAGGGTVHGPQPRDYSQRTPKKMISAALRGVLSDRAREDRVFVLNQVIDGEVPATKRAADLLYGLGDFPELLVVLDRDDYVGWMSLRNLAGVHVCAVDQLNAYDVVTADAIVFTVAALDAFVAGPPTGKSVKAVGTSSEVDSAADDVDTETPAEAETEAETEAPTTTPEAEAPKAKRTTRTKKTTKAEADEAATEQTQAAADEPAAASDATEEVEK